MTVSAPPAFLRWVVPVTIVGALMVLGLLLRVQHNRAVEFEEAGPAAVDIDTNDVPELQAWVDHAAPLMASLRSVFGDVGEAAKASDFVATSTACRAGLDLTGALVNELPSPDVRLNAPLREALDDYDHALRHCVNGSENNDPDELAIAADLVTAGDQRWRAAVGMMDTPWPALPPSSTKPSHVFKT